MSPTNFGMQPQLTSLDPDVYRTQPKFSRKSLLLLRCVSLTHFIIFFSPLTHVQVACICAVSIIGSHSSIYTDSLAHVLSSHSTISSS